MVLQRILSPQALERVRFLMSPPHLKLMFGSAILWGLGDVGAQAVTHHSDRRAKESEDKDEEFVSFEKKDAEFKIDWYRVYNTSCFGAGACIGPAAYYRLKSLQLQSSMYGLEPSRAKLVASTVLDGVFGALNLATFFPFMGLWHGEKNMSVEQAKEDLKRGFTPALVLGGAMVPAKLIISSRFVPAPYQLHCASLFALASSCSLSWIEQRRDADSWKKRLEKMEVQKTNKEEKENSY